MANVGIGSSGARIAAGALTGAGVALAVDPGGGLLAPAALLVSALAAGGLALSRWSRSTSPSSHPADSTAPLPEAGLAGPRDLVSIEALSEPVILVDAIGMRVESANAAALAMLGAPVLGQDLRVALRHPQILDAVAQTRERDEPTTRELLGFGRPESVFRMRAVGIGGGRQLLTFADITQARLTERMRVDFVANASHELRTPLASLLGFIETLQGPAAEDEPARRRFLEIMAREAQRMARLIDDLLSLSRIELDKYVQPRTAVDLGPLFSDVGKTLAVRLEADERRLETMVERGLPQVLADRDQILQVLHNLVSNALKYGRSGTPILIQAERVPARSPRVEPMVKVSVIDQGEGIAPEHLPRLTERFYRAHTGRARATGTGLGLAIVKHIVERHRGTLSIQSRPGEGTTVSFTLLEARAMPPLPAPAPAPAPAAAAAAA